MDPRANVLLASLPADEYESLAEELVERELVVGSLITEPGEPLSHLWFPGSGAISILEVTEDGASIECALVGADGAIGIWSLLPDRPSPWRALVQLHGIAWTIELGAVQRHLDRAPCLGQAVLRSSIALGVLISRSVVCNRFHRREQRLARWLLDAHDRAPSAELPLTHELLADTLGVHRSAITAGLRALEERGVIASRGRRERVLITDRQGLEDRACECYALLRERRPRSANLRGV